MPEGSRATGNLIVGGDAAGSSLNADESNVGPGHSLDHHVFWYPGPINWWGVIAQDLETSTSDQDPQLAADGTPGNTAIVAAKGPIALATLPFAAQMMRAIAGACFTQPATIGARQLAP